MDHSPSFSLAFTQKLYSILKFRLWICDSSGTKKDIYSYQMIIKKIEIKIIVVILVLIIYWS